MIACPRCGSYRIGRSHTRWHERLRRSMTGDLPFRCKECRWRGWMGRATTKRNSESPLVPRRSWLAPASAIGIATAIVLLLGVPWLVRGRAPAIAGPAPVATVAETPPQTPPLALLSSRAHLNPTADFWFIDGEVRNLTDQPLSNVQVVSTWFDRQGRTVASHSDMVDLKQLMPGETSAFRTITGVHPDMATFSLEFRSAVGRRLQARDDSQAP